MTLRKGSFQNIVGKEENAGNHHFLTFPQYFLPFPKQNSTFESHLVCRPQMISIRATGLKFCCFGKEFKVIIIEWFYR